MLRLEDVSKRYGSTHAVRPTDLLIEGGRTTVLIGPSGCGKSTLLRLMIGLITPDTGRVFFEDQVVAPDNVKRLRRRMGYVIQDGGLFDHMTARGNATIMPRHLGWSSGQIESRLDELVQLTHFPPEGLDRYPIQLSGGQRQRVSLIRALMLDPHMLLLDEPLGALDPMIRSKLQSELREIFQSLGKTVVMVTHDLGEAGFLGDSIVLLRDGFILQKGGLRELVEAPSQPFVTEFINAQRTHLDLIAGEGQ